MKFIHTADWHLGHVLYDYDRSSEHKAFLLWLLKLIGDEQPDALLVAGDVYDAVNPPIPAQQLLFRFLADALARAPQLQIVLVGGNHDSAARIELPRALLDPGRVYLVGSMPRDAGHIAPASVCFPLKGRSGKAEIICCAVPFLRPGDLSEHGIQGLYAEVVTSARTLHGNLPIVITGHLSVAGGEVSELSERRIIIGGEETVSASAFPAEASYVALGHLHRPQQISGAIPIRYSGSPIPLSVTERDYKHSVCVVELDNRHEASINCVHIPRTIDFLRIPLVGGLPLESLEERLRELPPGAGTERDSFPFLEVCVELSGPEPDLRRRIDAALAGRAARLTNVSRSDRTLAATDGQQAAPLALGDVSPDTVFIRCYNEKFPAASGEGPPERIVVAFKELLASAEVQEGVEANTQ